jgi:hypothetical protein
VTSQDQSKELDKRSIASKPILRQQDDQNDVLNAAENSQQLLWNSSMRIQGKQN